MSLFSVLLLSRKLYTGVRRDTWILWFRSPIYQAVGHCVPPAPVACRCLLLVRLSTVGSRAFPVAGPRIWNALPQETTSAHSLSLFRQRLKSHLFRRSSRPRHLMFCYRATLCTVSVIVILSVCPSVRPSVCLSHSWTVSTWFDLRS